MPEYLRFFTPSVLRVPPEALASLGAAGALGERVALRRVWNIGAATYQVVAIAIPVPGGQVADLLVRRRYTLELGAVVVAGSPVTAIERVIGWVEAFQRDDVALRALLAEYERRGVPAGLPIARELRQAFVLAPASVYRAAAAEVTRAHALRSRIEATPIGFRYLSIDGDGDGVRVEAAPPPWGEELSLVRSVEGSMKAV